MNDTHRPSGKRTRLLAVCLGALLLAIPSLIVFEFDSAPRTFAGSEDRTVGVGQCVDCHKHEVAAWKKSKHHGSAGHLTSDSGKKIAGALGVKTSDDRCVGCHGIYEADDGKVGVFCESCHGAGKDWVNRHHAYGAAKETTREQETAEHRASRRKDCDAAGMIRPENLYGLAQNCFGCHYGQDEKLVNEGGHKIDTADFELVEFSQGEVRHNFLLPADSTQNAEAPSLLMAERAGFTPQDRRRVMYVVGQMVALEATLAKLSFADEDDDYFEEMSEKCAQARENLQEINEVVELGEIAELLQGYVKITGDEDDDIEDLGFEDFKKKTSEVAALVQQAGKNARAVSEKYGGGGTDRLSEKLDDEIKILKRKKWKGDPHQAQ